MLFALAQHDLKRLLAYHSVENIGIIALGLGVGLLGISYGNPAMAALGSPAHCCTWSTMPFQEPAVPRRGRGAARDRHAGHRSAGRAAEADAGHRGDVPVGAAAISGLPPLNGFVSELLIYLGVLDGGGATGHRRPAWAAAERAGRSAGWR